MTDTATANRPWLPYVVPMVLFLALTALEGQLPHLYVPLYIAKVVVVLAALVFFRSVWKEITFDAKWIVPSVVIGVALFAMWIWVEKNVGYNHFLLYFPEDVISGTARSNCSRTIKQRSGFTVFFIERDM